MTTAPTFRELIAAGRIVEAKALLAIEENATENEELLACSQEIDQRYTQAASLVAQAESLEREGKSAAAKAMYESILSVAADFPGLEEHIKRMEEALLLTRAVQHRCERLRAPQPESAAAKNPPRLLPWIVGGLAIGLSAAAWLLFTTAPKPLPPAATPPSVPLSAAEPSVAPSRPLVPAPPPAPIDPVQSAPVASKPSMEAPNAAQAAPTSSPPAAPPPATAQQPSEQYVIQAGDSLSKIAEQLFCHEPLWHELYARNRAILHNPAHLQVGDVLQLHGIVSRCPSPPSPSPDQGTTRQ